LIRAAKGRTLQPSVFRAFYRAIKRFLAWANGGNAARATKEAADYRRDIASRHGGGGPDW
jgi:hypothetical protein